jgi:hypothetical protein
MKGGEGFCSHCLAKLGSCISIKSVLLPVKAIVVFSTRFGVRGVLSGPTVPIDKNQL